MLVLRRHSRSAATAVLAAVLAALMHALACAHGPEFGRAAVSDSLPVAAAAAVVTAASASSPVSAPAIGERGLRFAECTGGDDPGVLSRDVCVAPAPEVIAPASAVEPESLAIARRRAPEAGAPGDQGEQQRMRSVLGVWRT
ncbi:hypothetical protein [Streptomyces sp. NBC_01618]|uniref:hypothetical protein n=1 Tax=Streptomyces sp. NBC_01618 TaxID=2975900 RepID=UPI003869B9D5|nr:hypothetical protein OH735_11160 [Streptomyces sp. NBC_01618]